MRARGSYSNDAMTHRVLKTAQQDRGGQPAATNSVHRCGAQALSHAPRAARGRLGYNG